MGDAAEKEESEFLTVEEAAAILRVTKYTLYLHINAGNAPWANKIGRVIRINRQALMKAFSIDGYQPQPKKRRGR
jgi:excisionase family DNA binding protein